MNSKFLVPTILALIIPLFFCWSILIEPQLLFVHRFEIHPPRWPKSLDGMQLAVISDIHAGGLYIDENKIKKIVDDTNAAKPDLILLAGDYVDNTKHQCKMPPGIFCKILSGLHAPCGVFAVLGNHDWAYNYSEVLTALRTNNIPVLADDSRTLIFENTKFFLVGIGDKVTTNPDVQKPLRDIPSNSPILLFTHDPAIFPEIPARVNLTIAGHTHGGQVWLPLLHLFAPKMGCQEPYVKDVLMQNNRMLFISIGVGNSVFPIRFLNAPEISLLKLKSESSN